MDDTEEDFTTPSYVVRSGRARKGDEDLGRARHDEDYLKELALRARTIKQAGGWEAVVMNGIVDKSHKGPGGKD